MHQIVAAAIGTINPLTTITIVRSLGYTTNDDGTQVPFYDVFNGILTDTQDLTAGDIRKLEGLNLQGEKKSIYLNGTWAGIVRVDRVGGDLFLFGGRVWLGTAILEQWPDWAKVVVTLQNDPYPLTDELGNVLTDEAGHLLYA